MKEVDADLYEFLQEHETTIYKEDNQLVVAVFVYFFELDDFVKAVGKWYFDDGGIEVHMMNKYFCIPITDCIEGYGHNISSYRKCFADDVWIIYEKEILEMEGEN
jgi:hypothetical protein